jgi:hypothetical protein
MMDQAFTPKQIVAAGYDQIAERYSEWTGAELTKERAFAVAKVSAERFRVTGVDISARQIELARGRVRKAGFEVVSADSMTGDEDGVPVTFVWVETRKPETRS